MDDKNPAQVEHSRLFDEGDDAIKAQYEPVEVDLSGTRKEGEPDAGIKELERQLAEQQAATARAEAAAREQAQRAQYAERRVVGASVSMIDSAIETSTFASAQAKAKYEAALSAGDTRAAAQANEEMLDARHNLHRLQEQKAMVEMEARRPPPAPQPQPQQIDNAAVIQGLVRDGYQRSAEWLQNRPELLNPQMMRRVSSAHNHLVDNQGLVPESDEYFAAMEREVYRRQSPPASSAPARRPVGTAAPTSPRTPSLKTGEVRRDHIALTAEQRHAAAEVHGMTDKEFAEAYEDARVSGQLMRGAR